MFGWFNSNDFVNGLVTEFVAMAVEILIIIKILEWRRRREDDRKLRGYRFSTRRMLSRVVNGLQLQMEEAGNFVRSYLAPNGGSNFNEEYSLPSQPNPFFLIKDVHYQLTKDFADRYAVLDESTAAVMEGVLDAVENLLGIWAVKRLTDTRLPEYWPVEIEVFIRSLQRTEELLKTTKQLLQSVEASLVFAEHHNDKGGDIELVEEAQRLKKVLEAQRSA